MSKVIWLALATALLAGCLADNDTVQALRKVTAGDLMKMYKIEFTSPLPTPIYTIPRPTLER